MTSVLNIVCYKWFDPNGRWNRYFIYSAEHVNRLYAMLARTQSRPFRLICVTDHPNHIRPEVTCVPLPDKIKAWGKRFPKLMTFDPEWQAAVGGEHFLQIDLDCVVTADFAPVLDYSQPFRIWADASKSTPCNSSLIYLHRNTMAHVWMDFDPVLAADAISRTKYIGSDQAWIACCLNGEMPPRWDRKHGVLSYKRDCRRQRDLPSGARVVFFHGEVDPSLKELQLRHPWIVQHWRLDAPAPR